MRFNQITLTKLTILLLCIIVFVPFIYTLPALFPNYNYTITGQIGDTIGGLTAPFINAIAAILLFMAFREQIRANEIQTTSIDLIQNTERIKIALDSMNWLRQDEYGIHAITQHIQANLTAAIVPIEQFNKATYALYEIKNTLDYIEKNITQEKDELKTKLGVLYRVVYQVDLTDIHLASVTNHVNQNGVNTIVLSYTFLFQEVDRKLRI